MNARVSVAVVLALALAGPAEAATHRCSGKRYGLIDAASALHARELRVNFTRRIDGYAPPCLVAESLVGRTQRAYDRGRGFPTSVSVFGARWDGGRWSVRYRIGAKPRKRRAIYRQGRRRVTTMLIERHWQD